VVLHTRSCYGSVKNGFDSAILTKIPRMKKEERLGRRQTTKCGAKRQAHTLSQDHATTMRWPMGDARLWEMHVYERHAYEMAYGRMPVYGMHAYEMAFGRYTPRRGPPMRGTPMGDARL
jgi:hypothetical protein